MKKTLLFGSLLLLAACGGKKTEGGNGGTTATQTVATKPAEATPAPVVVEKPAMPTVKADTFCYAFHFKKDVNEVQLIVSGDDVTGILNYMPWEKDSGRGTLKGKKTGNDIVADYDYIIEGSKQKEEIHLRMAGDKLLKASAPLVERNGKLVVKDMSKAKYSESFTKVNCKEMSK